MLGHPPRNDAQPWEVGPSADRVAFAALWCTGADTTLDGVFRMLALRLAGDGSWQRFDRFCSPFPGQGQKQEAATARMRREFGVTRSDLAGAATAAEVWPAFREFVGERALVVHDAETFAAWREHLEGGEQRYATLGLTELGALLAPGRRARENGEYSHGARAERGGDAGARVTLPDELRAAAAAHVARFLERDPRVVRLAADGYLRAWRGLCALDPPAAQRLGLALTLLEQPDLWTRGAEGLLDAGELRAGCLSALAPGDDAPELLLEDLAPGCTESALDRSDCAPLRPAADGLRPFEAEDAALLDDVFRVHLPALFREERPGIGDPYRESQHAVAVEVAGTLGADELLLVHAPTGTGKTMAYLVPALLWARRHDLRVGVATYTRALQEQAMDREVPRALAALARADAGAGRAAVESRVALLKGRENYLCWRSLRTLVPDPEDEAETWLAWTSLALFALTDPDGDLDRFSLRAPVRLSAPAVHRRATLGLLSAARARSGCCVRGEDRATCAAEVARRRAERSHVVITNHAFALARQEFFRHVIFDECEHLHDQAHNAWSHSLATRGARGVLDRLHRPADSAGAGRGHGRGRGALERLESQLLPHTAAHGALTGALTALDRARGELRGLELELARFDRWRQAARRGRSEREEHSLLREYLDHEQSAGLLAARGRLVAAIDAADAALAQCAEHLEGHGLRGAARIRRGLDLGRSELAELLTALGSWIPMKDGAPALRRETFYDVEADSRGGWVLAARVLLPDEYLGRSYYPGLASAVFLSATTRIQGGFDAAKGYLGLARAETPAADEEREGRVVRCFHAPEVFDYGRVLVGLTRDAPPARDKAAFLDYIASFVTWLAERTRGRMLVLFTNLQDVKTVGEAVAPFFRGRGIPLWFQGMEQSGKEELADLFRRRVDSVLLGVDTFWYGADFPGETLEYLVIVKLPYGVPDRYHHAQCAALGEAGQRRRIYMPRALAKFRQGFGRLMRSESDRGCVFILDRRVLEPRHRAFLRELPVRTPGWEDAGASGNAARLVRGDTDRVAREALAHMGMLADMRRRGLGESFFEAVSGAPAAQPPREGPRRIDVATEDLPY